MEFNQPFEPPSSLGRGPRIGKFWGVTVRIHWSLLILFGMLLLHNYLRSTPLAHPFLEWLIFSAAIWVSLWTHEFAHCFVAHRQSELPEEVSLWPFGSLTAYHDGDEPTTHFWIAAAGPIADVAKVALAATVCLLCGWSLLPTPGAETGWPLRLAAQYFFLWNTVLLIHNLLPCVPLDAGRIIEAIRWNVTGTRSEATLAALKVGRFVAFAAMAVGIILVFASLSNKDFAAEHLLLYCLSWGLICAALFHFHEARVTHHRLRHEQGEQGIFGYDFSAGYTSLERTATQERKSSSLVGALSERFHQHEATKKEEQEAAMRIELDRVLAKIHDEGMGSLTRKEKSFLDDASRQLRS